MTDLRHAAKLALEEWRRTRAQKCDVPPPAQQDQEEKKTDSTLTPTPAPTRLPAAH